MKPAYTLDIDNASIGVKLNVAPIEGVPFLIIEGKMHDGTDHYVTLPIEPFAEELQHILSCHFLAYQMSKAEYN